MENDDGKNAIKIMCSMRTKPFMRVRNGFYAESRRMWPLNERWRLIWMKMESKSIDLSAARFAWQNVCVLLHMSMG